MKNLLPGDTNYLNEDLSQKICQRLVNQQLSQITTGGFEGGKTFWASLNLMPATSNKPAGLGANSLVKVEPAPSIRKGTLEESGLKTSSVEGNESAKPVEGKTMEGFLTGEKEKIEDDSMGKNSEDNFSPDTFKGKNPLKKKLKSCGNKFCKTDLSGWNSKFTRVKSDNNNYMMLCTNCAKAHRKGQYCYYCKQIYLDNDDDGKDWVQCDFCKKWVHADCEQYHGDPRFKAIMTSKDFIYYCPKCKKMKTKPTGSKRKTYEILDYLGKQTKKKKRFETSPYGILYPGVNNAENENVRQSPRGEEMMIFENIIQNGNLNDLQEVKRMFYEPVVFVGGANVKKPANGHQGNEFSYNSIDHLMTTYGLLQGVKLTLTENEVISDLNRLRGIPDLKLEDPKSEKQPEKGECEILRERPEKTEDSKERLRLEPEEDSNIDEKSEKSSNEKSEENEGVSGHGNNGSKGNNKGESGNSNRKKGQSNNGKNYSLRKGNQNPGKVVKIEVEETKSKEKGEAMRVLRNRKK